MGGVISSIFGGNQSAPEIEVSDPIPAPDLSSTEPVSKAARDTEMRRAKARRAFAGTLLTGGKEEKRNSLL